MPRTKVYLKVVNVTPKIVSRDANNVSRLSYTADIIWHYGNFSFQFNENREMIFDRNPEYFKESFVISFGGTRWYTSLYRPLNRRGYSSLTRY